MKESGWIRHDIGARNDVKIQKMVWRFGVASKAVYWDLIEMLAEENGRLSFDTIEYVSFSNGLKDTSLAESVVKESGLFQFNQTHFWSKRLLEEIRLTEELKEKKKRAGESSGAARRNKGINNQANKAIKANTVSTEMNTCSTESEQKPISVEPIQYNTEHNNTIQDNITDTNVSMSEKISDPEESPKENPLFVQESSEGKEPGQQPLSNKQCQQVVDFWNNTIKNKGANFPKVVSLSDDRKKKIRVRWAEFSQIGDPIEVTRKLFANACESKFLQGDNNNGWSASFDWIFTNSKNWVKVYEGNYDNKTGTGKKIDTGKDIDALWEHQ